MTSLSPHKFHPDKSELPEFSPSERHLLLNLAHRAILVTVEEHELVDIPHSPHFEEPRGVFTTIYLNGALRGCVGYVFADKPLYETVIYTARACAFEDIRFAPVTRDEASQLEISLSILSRLQPITPDKIEIGLHGLLIAQHGRRGLLLPQVAVECGWDRVTFLEQTCRKAGLPEDAWKNGANIEAFTAEVFGDASS
ncbi:MAG TPA: AmmeMemoRadiSam system protein A [Terriglobales bacterium]|nr:AmmeMemoRadiSam system protein A [Terriglobales bacterium]